MMFVLPFKVQRQGDKAWLGIPKNVAFFPKYDFVLQHNEVLCVHKQRAAVARVMHRSLEQTK